MSRLLACSVTAALIIATLGVQSAGTQVLQAPFDAHYALTDLGSVPNVPTRYGGLNFLAGDPNTIIIGGAANGSGGLLYSSGVVRGAGNHITSFSGAATVFADAAFNDGGVAYGPGNVLFLARWPSNEIGQTKPGSTVTDKIVGLAALGVTGSPGGVTFVPSGFPGAGQLKIAGYNDAKWWTLSITPDGTGTFDITAATFATTIQGGPEGFVYVPPGSPDFTDFGSLLVSEYDGNAVTTYAIDANGDPLLATRAVFIDGLTGAEGAISDPLTNDFLFSTFGGGDHVIVVRGFGSPTTTTTTTTLPGCGTSATYESIDCRLDELVATLDAAQDLGRLRGGLVTAATKARAKKQQAEGFVATGKKKQEKNAMKKAVKALASFLHKASSHSAKKLIPPATRQMLIDKATPILSDMKMLLRAL